MKILIFITVILFISLHAYGQTIYKTWYGSNNLTLKIEFPDRAIINHGENVKIKVKGDKLKILTYYYIDGIIFWRHKETCKYKIEKLTADTLILTQKVKENRSWEFMTDSVLTFTDHNSNNLK